MSFRGELREFELPDILQLIASQKKAGWLKVISKGECHFVFFRDGKITSTKNPSEENDPFEDFITRRAVLTDEQSDRVAAIRRKTGMDVPDILKKEGLLGPEEIQELFEAMVEQDIFELMSIRAGTYEFETEERPTPLPEGALSAEIGPILMEGARKADEVSEMRKALGPEDGVLVLSAAGRQATPEHADERTLLALVNGVRSIDALIEDCGLDRYAATRTLYDCARHGWVSLLRSSGLRSEDHGPETTIADRNRVLHALVPALVLLLASLLFSDALDRFRAEDPIVGEWLKWHAEMDTVTRREAVRVAAEAYRLRHGSYPGTLSALADDKLLDPSALDRDDRSLWVYQVSPAGDSYALAPAPAESAK